MSAACTSCSVYCPVLAELTLGRASGPIAGPPPRALSPVCAAGWAGRQHRDCQLPGHRNLVRKLL